MCLLAARQPQAPCLPRHLIPLPCLVPLHASSTFPSPRWRRPAPGHRSSQTNFASTAVGTPYYLSPELIMASGYDGRADIWSLGVILYELITFERQVAQQTTRHHMHMRTGSPSHSSEPCPPIAAAPTTRAQAVQGRQPRDARYGDCKEGLQAVALWHAS